jgi:AraC-like DNA-binding protein
MRVMAPQVLACVADEEYRGHLAAVLDGRAQARFVTGLRNLSRGVTTDAPQAIILAVSADVGDAEMVRAVEQLRRQFPLVPIIAYCWLTAQTAVQLLGLVRAGVTSVVLRGYNDLCDAVVAALGRTEESSLTEQILTRMEPFLAPPVRPIFEVCIRRARELPSVAEIASDLGLNRKTIANRLRSASLPPLAASISWSRLFVAARLLEDAHRPVGRIALHLGFASGSALRGMLKRYTGLTPGEVRGGGGLDRVIDAMCADRGSGDRLPLATSNR